MRETRKSGSVGAVGSNPHGDPAPKTRGTLQERTASRSWGALIELATLIQIGGIGCRHLLPNLLL
jgi:hypothetical protein